MNSTQATENMLGQDKVTKYLGKVIDKNKSLKNFVLPRCLCGVKY